MLKIMTKIHLNLLLLCAMINGGLYTYLLLEEGYSMQYIMTFFWTFLLTEMLTYVVSSMNGAEFNFMTGLILSIIATILLFIFSALLTDDQAEQH
ncbi:hypothetical protein SD78_3274 [Bacillus badius]|nr:hypothetical protein SD78_3274 [Bacillus badius]